MSHIIGSMVPDPESHIRRDGEHSPKHPRERESERVSRNTDSSAVDIMREDVRRHLESAKRSEESHESLLSGRQPYFSNINLDPTPLSPRQPPQEDRRPSLHAIPPRPIFKPPPQQPNHFGNSTRRYGSIGTAPGTTSTGNHSPNFHRSLQHLAPAVQPPQIPMAPRLASVTAPDGPNLARRHTAADIRVPSWTNQGSSPFASGQSSSNWPSSPHQAPSATDQHVRDVLASYELGAPRRQPPPPPPQPHSWHQQSINYGSNQTTPPLSTSTDTTASTLSAESGWSLSGGGKFSNTRHLVDSAPQTRRSSMASNVHSLLNPAETVERDEDDGGGEERKRKRVG